MYCGLSFGFRNGRWVPDSRFFLNLFNFQLIFRTSPDEPNREKQSVVSFYNFYAFNLLLNHIGSFLY